MKISIIIPAFNEAKDIHKLIESIAKQTHTPNQVIIVDDNSTDQTFQIASSLADKHPWLQVFKHKSSGGHKPGKKVINAFNFGLEFISLDDSGLIGKFDADIVLPPNYFENIVTLFKADEKIGIAGGNLYIKQQEDWVFEDISEKTKVRGPIKLYRKQCFQDIGGLKASIGWDTVDELLAQYHGWKIQTDTSLHVKHLKPTGQAYSPSSRYKQGEAFYKLRYGFLLTIIASGKLAVRKKSTRFFIDCLKGFFEAKKNKLEFLVSEKEGEFIRQLRWKGIQRKLFK